MKRSRHAHDGESFVRSPRVESLLEDFGGADSVPSVPIASSERGADHAQSFAPTQKQAIVMALRAAGCIPGSTKYLSREQLIERVGMSEKAACGRLGPSGKMVITAKLYRPGAEFEVISSEDVCVASSGLRVVGYQLSVFGVDRAAELARQGRRSMTPYYQDDFVTLYHGDCRDVLPTLDRADLLLTDPPYGIGRDGERESTGSHGGRKAYPFRGWDRETPDAEVFSLMFARSRNQIIWGANYFTAHLPPSMGWIVWDKGQRIAGSDGELAFTSYQGALRIVTMNRVEIAMDGAVHPTQKPLRLMTSCLVHADKQGEVRTVLDPFAGSGTTLVAEKNLNRLVVGIEREEAYCEMAASRLSQSVLDFGGAA